MTRRTWADRLFEPPANLAAWILYRVCRVRS